MTDLNRTEHRSFDKSNFEDGLVMLGPDPNQIGSPKSGTDRFEPVVDLFLYFFYSTKHDKKEENVCRKLNVQHHILKAK